MIIKLVATQFSFSFILKNLSFIIKHDGYHLSSSAKIKTRFPQIEHLKKWTNFEEQKGTMYIQGIVFFNTIVFSSLSSTILCLEFNLICFAREIKGFYQIS